jgi:hypothetical protein
VLLSFGFVTLSPFLNLERQTPIVRKPQKPSVPD